MKKEKDIDPAAIARRLVRSQQINAMLKKQPEKTNTVLDDLVIPQDQVKGPTLLKLTFLPADYSIFYEYFYEREEIKEEPKELTAPLATLSEKELKGTRVFKHNDRMFVENAQKRHRLVSKNFAAFDIWVLDHPITAETFKNGKFNRGAELIKFNTRWMIVKNEDKETEIPFLLISLPHSAAEQLHNKTFVLEARRITREGHKDYVESLFIVPQDLTLRFVVDKRNVAVVEIVNFKAPVFKRVSPFFDIHQEAKLEAPLAIAPVEEVFSEDDEYFSHAENVMDAPVEKKKSQIEKIYNPDDEDIPGCKIM